MVVKFVASLLFVFSQTCAVSEESLRDFHYDVELKLQEEKAFLQGLSDIISESEIKSKITQLRIFALKDKPISSISALSDRLENDVETMHKILHVLGYYNAKIRHSIKEKNGRVSVLIKVDPKEQFKLDYNVNFLDQNSAFKEYHQKVLKRRFQRCDAAMPTIKESIEKTIRYLKNYGFYDPQIITKKVFINYEEKTATLNLEIITGLKVNFGETRISAFEGISEQFIRNRLTWARDELFSEKKVERSIEKLKDTQIFSSVKISPIKDEVNEKGLPMLVEVEEDKKHLVSFGIVYAGVRNMNFEKQSATKRGLKSLITRFSWTRYNAFGNGETLTINTEMTPMKARDRRPDYGFEILLQQPDVLYKDGTAEYKVSRHQELTNVFFRKIDQLGFLYSYPLSDTLLSRIGVSTERHYVDADEILSRDNACIKKYYKLVSVPLDLAFNQTNNFFDPSQGYKLSSRLTLINLPGNPLGTLKRYRCVFSYYYPINGSKRNLLAFKIGKHGLLGAEVEKVPIDQRIYAGGMRSVRGFANQMATEIVRGTQTVMGGTSALEFTGEYRRRINSEWGATVFVDGAKVSGNYSRYFEIEKKRWFKSIGFGVRYFSSIGPLRLDFAFPMNRRKGVDSRMQFIMSLGQSF